MIGRVIGLAAGLLALAGCATTTASLPLRQCRLPVAPLKLAIPALVEGPTTESTGGEAVPMSPFATTVRGRLGATRPVSPSELESAPEPVRALILSGGGEWGAFGTGFLTAWPALPRFDVVTGVSTGALQATFAFLGARQAPANPALTADADFPAGSGAAGRRYVDDTLAGYGITRQETLYKSSGTGGIIRRAAQGTLDPLRMRLERLVTPDVLAAVAQENAAGRQLWVAVLNWNSGDTEAVDMGQLAARAATQPFMQVRDCYIDALIAAASEPLGARPERLDESMPATQDMAGMTSGERLYFDAGLRYGVFLDELKRSVAGLGGAELYVIVNGDLAVAPWNAPKWNALDLAGRGRKILVNQVYRFSTYDLLRRADDGVTVRLAYVAGPALEKCAAIRDGEKGPDTFHPAFMRCLLAEGQRRGAGQVWQQ